MEKSFMWIKSAIATSTNEFHLECCNSLIKLFADKYLDDAGMDRFQNELITELFSKGVSISITA